MNKFLSLVLLAGSLSGFAQKPEKFGQTITAADLRKHLYIIASREMEGRETATPGQRKAAEYIENQFRQIGLQPGNNGNFQMMFNVYQDSLVSASLEVNGKAFQLDQDFNPSIANLATTLRFSEVVVISTNTSLDTIRAANLGGKMVMVLGSLPTPQRGQQGGVLPLLQQKGIAGIISVSSMFPRKTPANRKSAQTLNLFRRNLPVQQYSVSENVARAIMGSNFEAAMNNKSIFTTQQANISFEVQKTTITAQSSNVVGVLPGTDLKDEYLFITAHYDHLGKRDTVIYYGADDDGSGTVGVIEMAEAFAKAKAAGKGPRRSIVFMTVSGEEKGLWGSEYYSNNPIYPLEKTTANLNIDMIGRSDASRQVGDSNNYVYVVGDDKLSSELRIISEAANKKYIKMELDYKFNDPKDPNFIYFRSDHYNFARKGVPIVFYYDGMLGADYHKPTDTVEKINYDLMTKRARLVFYTAWEMANRDGMLKRDIPLDTSFMSR